MSINDSIYSDSDDGSSISSVDSIVESKPKKNIEKINIESGEDSESEESSVESEGKENDFDSDDDDDKLKIGGADSDLEEPEIEESDDNNSDNEDIELDEDGEPIEKKSSSKSLKVQKPKKSTQMILQEDDDEDEELDDSYLQKFDSEITKNYLTEFHPECFSHNYDEISKLSNVVRNSDNIIIDPLHKTIPFLTKYEKARILGQRAKQIETGSKPFVKIPESIVDSYIIAELELREKKIPFIIKRPIPSGGFEYWHLKDLEIIGF
jgi:DNA-directed RNA polymerase I, II, and III subunit RPABC2